MIDPEWQNPEGVPISAILFGGRRPSTVPLVNEAFDWEHGVFMGSAAGSETTAAALGKAGVLRHDPFAMLPFCGYNMGDYFAHWLSMAERTDPAKLPKVFFVNWFRKGEDGHWLWPGYGENSRVLKWIFERVEGGGEAVETPIGNLPTADALDLSGSGHPRGRPADAAHGGHRGLEEGGRRSGDVLRRVRRPAARGAAGTTGRAPGAAERERRRVMSRNRSAEAEPTGRRGQPGHRAARARGACGCCPTWAGSSTSPRGY